VTVASDTLTDGDNSGGDDRGRVVAAGQNSLGK